MKGCQMKNLIAELESLNRYHRVRIADHDNTTIFHSQWFREQDQAQSLLNILKNCTFNIK